MAARKRTKVTSSTTAKAAAAKTPETEEKVVKVPESTVEKKTAEEKPVTENQPAAEKKAPAAKKTAEKKPAAKKAAAKTEMKVKAVVEYYGKQVEEKDMIASVKKAWTKSGKKVGDIKTMELYIKPEEAAVYYVINGTDTGAVAF